MDKSAIKAHRTFLEVVLGDCGSQPTKNSEPERQKLAAETTARIEKLKRLIALVGDDGSLAGHKASLERDLASAKKLVSKSSRPIAIEIEEKSKYIAREKARLQQLVEDVEKAKSVLEARTVSLQRDESRLAELRAELVSVPANMDVDASELKDSEQQEIEQLRLLATERCPIQLASKQNAVRSRRNVAGEAGNSLHLCVISWNVAGIPLDDLDVWLQQVSDHFPWDLICLQEGFKRLNGIAIGGGHGIFTLCRQLGVLRSPAIIVRCGSACDDVVFLPRTLVGLL